MTSAFPILYAGTTIGELRLAWRAGVTWRDDTATLLAEVARQCGLLVKRYEVRRWTEQHLGRSVLLLGMSRALRELEGFVEKAAQNDLPVLLAGEFGTEKPYLAAAIHCCSRCRDGPFVQVNCAEPVGTPADWFRQAAGGSLFLSDIDLLAPHYQHQVPQFMYSRLGHWLDLSKAPKVRLVASTTDDLRLRVREGSFSRILLAELDFLSATVPPLRERSSDIETLVAAALERHGHRAQDKLTDTLVELCRAYSWPENLFELDRVVARLAVMTDRDPIRGEDVRRHAPWLLSLPMHLDDTDHPVPHGPDPDGPDPDGPDDGEGRDEDSAPPLADDWARRVLLRDFRDLGHLHPGLRRALAYLADNYAEPLLLGDLARRVNVSQSHLSFLFRSGLQQSCKALLNRIRIHRAQDLLVEEPRLPVTEVALRVGYTDLSHFEKSFRRQVGQNPRAFRRAVTGQ
ncbi:helix-turn-helix domain-containing protein [Nitrospirillum sp. BR 11163]|uniref:helix-turn-helix domain-containing protein n=1 Tax=Nitrospirillum sp. BR 11163 TaxID=3104323 RepID=UPI002B0003E8|nr:helix-turn-helix domain-containing protein [Nitrospirillum sp. BR 11163]MEA1672206.1 helix-turn-helix domain-containing protein [Nitrospirillum sp. BR 11163]